MKTRLPRTSTSASRRNPSLALIYRASASMHLRHQRDRHVEHAVAEAPLVVVPADTLTRRPDTLVSVASKVDDAGSWLKSTDTSGALL